MTKRLRSAVDKDANAYAGMQCTELPSLHNTPKLLVDGCVYRLDEQSGRKFNWLCDSRIACPVRLTTTVSAATKHHVVIDVGVVTVHTHPMTVDPMEGVHSECLPIKTEDGDNGTVDPRSPVQSTMQLLHDASLECSIVLQPSNRTNEKANQPPQLCVSNRQLYNLRGTPVDQLYRWECSNRTQLLCGSRIQTCHEGGRHVAVQGSFLEHCAKCERLHGQPEDPSDSDAKVEQIECDFEQSCMRGISPDGGCELLTTAGFTYQLRSLQNRRYDWRCVHVSTDLPCTGRIATALVAGRHVILVNSLRAHTDHVKGLPKSLRRVSVADNCVDKSEDDEHGSESDDSDDSYCPVPEVKMEHCAPDSPPTDDESAFDAAHRSDDSEDDDDEFKRNEEEDSEDNDNDDDDEDYNKPISKLITQQRQRRPNNVARPLLRGPNESVPCFTIPTTRGNDKLCVDGYDYYQERKPVGKRAYWACAKRKTTQCCGRLVTVHQDGCYDVQSITMRPHNHDPCVTNADQMSAIAQLRKMALESRCSAISIAAAVMANCTTQAKSEMPSTRNLMRKVYRVRASAGISQGDENDDDEGDDALAADNDDNDDDGDDVDVADDDGKIEASTVASDAANNDKSQRQPVRRSNSRYMDLDPNVPIVCSTVPSRRGNEKLCVLGYVYHLERKATNKSYHWACERRKRYDPPCLARVVTQLDDNQLHVIDRRRGVRAHNHTSPPDDGAATRRPSRRPYNADELREAESRRLERQLETNSVIPCSTIPTARGNETLFVQGYMYHCDRRSELFVYWKCVLSKLPGHKCPGRVTTTLQGEQHVVLSATLREHTHTATDSEQERYGACAQLRQLAQETQLDADTIIAMVLADCSEECRAKLGSISVLKKKVVRARNGEDRVSKVWREQMLTPLERERWAAIGRLKDMARQTTMDARSIVAAVLVDCTPECRTKLGNVVELRKKVGRVRLAKDKRDAKQRAKAKTKATKLAAADALRNGDRHVEATQVMTESTEPNADIKREEEAVGVVNKVTAKSEPQPQVVLDGNMSSITTNIPFSMDVMLNHF